MRFLFFASLCLCLFACSKKSVNYNYPDNPDYARNSRAGMAFSKQDLVLFGKKSDKKAAEKSENVKSSLLWKSALDVVSGLFPIAIIDSDSGIIISEWYHDENSDERIKINALVKGAEVKKENLQITIFRQKKVGNRKDSTWGAPSLEDSDSKSLSAKLIQEKILERAQK